VTYHPSVAATDCDSVDVMDDGTVLVDSLTDYTSVVSAPLIADSGDRLIVNAEEAASNETTHLVTVAPLHTPTYDLWR